MNRWGIPKDLEDKIKARDKCCIYCGVRLHETIPLSGLRKAMATWEHIINDVTIKTSGNIARCCVSCNASKGKKPLRDWLRSKYCKEKGINKNTVALVVRRALRR